MKSKKYVVILASAASFFLGVAFLFMVLRLQPELGAKVLGQSAPPPPRPSAIDPFAQARQQLFGGEDPLEEMEKLEEKMGQGLGGGLFRIQGGEEQEVVRKEDEKSVSFEISGVDQTKLSTKVEQGYLTIEGESKKESGGGGFSATMQSSFHRSFPLPPNVDEKKMEMSSEKDKVILRFPKKG
jgi:HSP20 family molecular chaperone IbpA